MSDGEFQLPEWPPEGTFEYHLPTGVEMIAIERREQKVKHNKSIKHDYEQYPDFELADAAEALISNNLFKFPRTWNLEYCKKLLDKPYMERLVVAGAFLAAQIDVLNFRE